MNVRTLIMQGAALIVVASLRWLLRSCHPLAPHYPRLVLRLRWWEDHHG